MLAKKTCKSYKAFMHVGLKKKLPTRLASTDASPILFEYILKETENNNKTKKQK
jgi:hypothetical protein